MRKDMGLILSAAKLKQTNKFYCAVFRSTFGKLNITK